MKNFQIEMEIFTFLKEKILTFFCQNLNNILMQTELTVNDHLKKQKVQTLYDYILDQNARQKSLSKKIESILTDFNLKEIDLLKLLSEKLKITQENVEIILQNSKNFNLLEESCQFYKEIIENSFTNQKNFLNILILNHLLTNLQLSNIDLYLIYFNFFISDMDIASVYQIIITHCYGLPNSLYEISIFLNKLIKQYQNQHVFNEVIRNHRQQYLGEWEPKTIQYFLQQSENHKQKTIKKIELKLIQKFENAKNRKVSNSLVDVIMHDRVEDFRIIRSSNGIDVDCSINFSDDMSNYWPFGFQKQIKLIELAAFSKSTQIFKNLILNHAAVYDSLIDYAVAGGNTEIIHICEQKQCEVRLRTIEFSIRYYQNDILNWLVENNKELIDSHIDSIFYFTCQYSNPQAFVDLYNYGYSFSTRIDMFHSYNQEWLNYFATIETIRTNIYNQLKLIKLDTNAYRASLKHGKYIVEKLLMSAQAYLQVAGDLDQYKNQIIEPNLPNEFILDLMFKENNYRDMRGLISVFTEEFLIFLIKNDIMPIDFILCSDEGNEIVKYLEDETYLHMIDDYNHDYVKKQLSDYFLSKGWYSFVIHRKSGLRNHFLKEYLADDESTFSLQTEGFCYSCFYGDFNTVSHFLRRKHVDFNSKQFLLNQTPLILAARSGFVNVVKLLIDDERIDVNCFCDEFHQTPFFYSCENNYYEIAELLLNDKRVDINIANNEGKTPFLVACENGYDKIVKMLMNKNKDFCLDKQAFNLAFERKYHKIVKLFIENNNNDLSVLIDDPLKILQDACFYCDLRMVKLLFSVDFLAKKTEEKSVQSSLLRHSCANENKEIIDFLKDKGFEINEDDNENIIESKLENKIEYKKNPLIDRNSLALISIIVNGHFLEERKPSDIRSVFETGIEKFSVNLDDYELSLSNEINNKDCGLYFVATRKSDNKKIIVQLINYDQFIRIKSELAILQQIDHPIITKIIGFKPIPLFNCKVFKQVIFSFSEYYQPHGTLESYMANERNGMADPKFNLTKKYIILLGVSHAMKCLHQKYIIYKNLHPGSIILDENLYSIISSLKFANLHDQPLQIPSYFRKDPYMVLTPDMMKKIPYCAPELIYNKQFERSVDVYSFGMITYTLFSLKEPFDKNNSSSYFFCDEIDQGRRPIFNNYTPI